MIFAIIALLAFTLIGPPIKRGSRVSSNNAAGVRLPLASVIEKTGQSHAGVKAQEVGEFKLAWLCGIATAAPVSLVFLDNSFLSALAFIVLATFAQMGWRLATNSFDYVGHNLEIMVAETEGRDGYREAEIGRMINLDPSRKGMTHEQVDRRLRAWAWLARIVKVLP